MEAIVGSATRAHVVESAARFFAKSLVETVSYKYHRINLGGLYAHSTTPLHQRRP